MNSDSEQNLSKKQKKTSKTPGKFNLLEVQTRT